MFRVIEGEKRAGSCLCCFAAFLMGERREGRGSADGNLRFCRWCSMIVNLADFYALIVGCKFKCHHPRAFFLRRAKSVL